MDAPKERRQLVFAVIRMLTEDLGRCKEETRESLEVAVQCLSEVYGGLEIDNVEQQRELGVPYSLQSVFDDALTANTQNASGPAEADLARASQLKETGNDLLRNGQFEQAVECYTQALQLDKNNPIYYCNRAAAYSKLQEHEKVVTDCSAAVRLDPNYSKAFGRMGLAYMQLNMPDKAEESYRKAVQLDPSNASYKEKLESLKMRASATQGASSAAPTGSAGAGAPPTGPNLGGLDFSAVLNNPSFMNMAQSLMSNPAFANMASGLMGGGSFPQGSGDLLSSAQQLAEQMQESNPELVDQVRQQMGQGDGDGQPDGGAGQGSQQQ